MTRRSTQVLVAGTAGGVGATTAAALLFAALARWPGGSPRLLDHASGALSRRLAVDAETIAVRADLVLHDLGPYAVRPGFDRPPDPRTVLVLVAPATPVGINAAEGVLSRIAQPTGSAELARVIVACVGVFGRHRLEPALTSLRARLGADHVVIFHQDRALAAGGPIPEERLSARTVRGQSQLGSVVGRIVG